MRHRDKNGKPSEKWALEAPTEAVELALFDLRNDANESEYQKLAEWFRQKLGRIILGDRRLEADWSQESSFHVSNFAEGAHDGQLDIPVDLIPSQGAAKEEATSFNK